MNVIRMVASSSFITVNIAIAHEVGLDAAVILGELASSQVYWEDKGLLNEEGMFFETAEQIEEKMKGVPEKKYFLVDGDAIGSLLENNFSKNLKTRFEETSKQDSKKLESNNKRINKNIKERTESNKTVLDSTLSDPVKEKLIDFLEYRKEIKKPYKSERSIKSLVTQVEKQEQRIGSIAVIECIDKTMRNGWQGLFWEKEETKRANSLESKLQAIDSWGGTNAESLIV